MTTALAPALERRIEVFEDESGWLEARRSGIGGSDAGAVLGLSPYVTPLQVFLDKIGEGVQKPPNAAMRRGQRFEAAIADEVACETGRELVDLGRLAIIRHPKAAWHFVSPDRIMRGDPKENESVYGLPLPGGDGLLEIKHVGARQRKHWRDGSAPAHYMAQLLHGLSVTGLRWGTLAALIGGEELVVIDVAVDEQRQAQINALRAREALFWTKHVLQRQPPFPANPEEAAALAKLLYPRHVPGKAVQLPDSLYEAHLEYVRAKAEEKDAKERKEAAADRIRVALADAEIGVFSDGTTYTYREQVTQIKATEAHERRSRVLREAKRKGLEE